MIWKNSHLPLAILMDEDLVVWLKKGIPLTCDSTWLGLGLDSENGFTPKIYNSMEERREFETSVIVLCSYSSYSET